MSRFVGRIARSFSSASKVTPAIVMSASSVGDLAVSHAWINLIRKSIKDGIIDRNNFAIGSELALMEARAIPEAEREAIVQKSQSVTTALEHLDVNINFNLARIREEIGKMNLPEDKRMARVIHEVRNFRLELLKEMSDCLWLDFVKENDILLLELGDVKIIQEFNQELAANGGRAVLQTQKGMEIVTKYERQRIEFMKDSLQVAVNELSLKNIFLQFNHTQLPVLAAAYKDLSREVYPVIAISQFACNEIDHGRKETRNTGQMLEQYQKEMQEQIRNVGMESTRQIVRGILPTAHEFRDFDEKFTRAIQRVFINQPSPSPNSPTSNSQNNGQQNAK